MRGGIRHALLRPPQRLATINRPAMSLGPSDRDPKLASTLAKHYPKKCGSCALTLRAVDRGQRVKLARAVERTNVLDLLPFRRADLSSDSPSEANRMDLLSF
jgi:hypothetical protein